MRPHGTPSMANSFPVAPAFPGMTQGDGENSYSKNSHAQGSMMKGILPTFFDAIKSMTLPETDYIFRIADLGCSSGPNTIANVEAFIEQVRLRYRDLGKGMDTDSGAEVQVFFQDLPSNDFNTLFKHLFSRAEAELEKRQDYMSAAVPGSFYNRLLPKSTVNITLSTFALHWLAKIPDAVRDRKSPAYNGGHTDIHRSSLATVQAYAEQADKDLDNFLAARAHELVPGGLIFLTFMVRQTGFYPYKQDPCDHVQEDVWKDLVSEGSVSEELMDSYNVPLYYRTMEEVNKQLEMYNSVFEVLKREIFPQTYASIYPGAAGDLRRLARERVGVGRGVYGAYIEAFLGKVRTDLLYERWEKAAYELLTRMKSANDPEGAEEFAVSHVLALTLRRR